MRESRFFKSCGTFCFDLYWKYHNFERIEIRATVFLKQTNFSEPKIRYFFPILSWIYVDNIKILRNKDLKHAPHFLGTRNPRITRNSRRRGIYLGISERIRVLYQYIISLIRIWTTQLFPRTKSSLTQGPYVQIILII